MKEFKLDYNLLMIKDARGEERYFGGNQEWYKTRLQRLAGCGATTGSCIAMYENRKRGADAYTKKEFLDLMEVMWTYITPGRRGVDSVDMFAAGFERYLSENGVSFGERCAMEILPKKEKRPSKSMLFDYLRGALERDTPVAFLNLGCGRETRLDSWHWVTITGAYYRGSLDMLTAEIADESMLKEIDLGLWLETAEMGGGFVHYRDTGLIKA
ncbi:MAG: hypothetical protein IKD89_08565 [Clostridia bacterium]|nr:hypothetical protein [Clostridia bacterium]